MIKLPLRLAPPTTEMNSHPTRRPNADYRTREHLTQAEVDRLIKAAGKNRWGIATPLSSWWSSGTAYVHRNSPTFAGIRSTSTPRPCMSAGSRRARLRPIRSVATSCGRCVGSSGSRIILAVRLHQRARRAVHYGGLCPHDRAGWRSRRAGLQGYPHMFRHATGYALANAGHDTRALQSYLGHRNIPAHGVGGRGHAYALRSIVLVVLVRGKIWGCWRQIDWQWRRKYRGLRRAAQHSAHSKPPQPRLHRHF